MNDWMSYRELEHRVRFAARRRAAWRRRLPWWVAGLLL
jgi:hypothetical protein